MKRRRGSRRAAAPLAVVLLAGLAVASGCAGRQRYAGVPIDQRPTPPSPDELGFPTDSTREAPAAKPGRTDPPTTAPVEAVMSAEERRAAHQRIAADTTVAGAAVRRCAAKTLLPDQESVFETTHTYLVQARAALRRNDLWQAESLARKARQLAASLECH